MSLVGLVAVVAGYILPQFSLYPDIMVRSLLVTVIFTAGVYFWRLSDDMNGLIASFVSTMKK